MHSLYALPNANSYSESLSFRTRYFESTNGNKNTEPMLVDYKYKCKYSTLIFYTGRHRAFINLFRDGLTATVLHPLWGQPATITETLVETLIIPCEHQNSEFSVGDAVFISCGYDNFNIRTLLEITPSNLIIDEIVDISLGSIVLPSFMGIVVGEINTTYSEQCID